MSSDSDNSFRNIDYSAKDKYTTRVTGAPTAKSPVFSSPRRCRSSAKLFRYDVACCSSRLPPKWSCGVAHVGNMVNNDDPALCSIVLDALEANAFRRATVRANSREQCDCLECIGAKLYEEEAGSLDQQSVFERKNSSNQSCSVSIQSSKEALQDRLKSRTAAILHLETYFLGKRGSSVHGSSVIHTEQPLRSHSLILETKNGCYHGKVGRSPEEGNASDKKRSCFEEARRSVAIASNYPEVSERWNSSNLCDLCNFGPSLSLGEWFAWCCGIPAARCRCVPLKKIKNGMMIGSRRPQGKKLLRNQWSGTVHKMCALWSSEVFEKDDSKKGRYLKRLDAAVKRGNNIICGDPECRKAGATLGCRVKDCRRSYHYPCAERLASRCLVRMWDCFTIPVACINHRYVEFEVDRAKKKVFPARVTSYDGCMKTSVRKRQYCLGNKLLSDDIAEGQEVVRIPCTNDVDDDSVPVIKYITKCWYDNSTWSLECDRNIDLFANLGCLWTILN